MSGSLLLDTHIWLWFAEASRRLKTPAREAIESAVASGEGLSVSIMSIWEISLLTAKGRIHLGMPVDAWVEKALTLPALKVMPLEPALIFDAHRLPGDFHADPADRLIVATARHHELTLITDDWKILDYGAQGYLRARASHDKELMP